MTQGRFTHTDMVGPIFFKPDIATMRGRHNTGLVDVVGAIESQATVLIMEEFVEAGLNLHNVASDMIFYNLPWQAVRIDQLIGRLDRLRAGGLTAYLKDRSVGTIGIWRMLLSGRADVALLAEPGATAAMMRGRADGQDLNRGVQMRDELGAITGLRPSLPQAALAMRADFASQHPWLASALTEALAKAAEDLNANPAQAAENAAPFVERAAPMLAQAIPFANINVLAAHVARPEVEALYQALIAADAGIIGGALPDDGLYAL